ncbi:hypothetical protein K1719_046861 [Acacia pycnantha]|nr:hypothetical protein K1719_046861 [Acacia pycnantha]
MERWEDKACRDRERNGDDGRKLQVIVMKWSSMGGVGGSDSGVGKQDRIEGSTSWWLHWHLNFVFLVISS